MSQIDRERISQIIKGEIRERIEGWQASFTYLDTEGKEVEHEFNVRREVGGERDSGKTLALSDLKGYMPPWMTIRHIALPYEPEMVLSKAAE